MGYPVLRAALMTMYTSESLNILKFFIRRNARLDVTDHQGRQVVHFVSQSRHDDIFKTVLRDRENSNAAGKLGRMPIHFAAANHDTRFLDHLLDTGKITDIDARDLDQWALINGPR